MTQNNQAVIIRFHYDQNDKRFEWRFQYFKDHVLPCLLEQTVSNFDIAIRCNPWHADLFKELSPRIIPFHVKDEHTSYKQKGRKSYFFDFIPWENVIDLPEYEIQYGLDSDDLITPDYIETLQKVIEGWKPEVSTLHVSFQPELLDVKTQKVSPIGQEYSPEKGSAFMAIYQPRGTEPYRFVYEQSHLTLGSLFEKSITLPKGKCFASVHSYNESTGK